MDRFNRCIFNGLSGDLGALFSIIIVFQICLFGSRAVASVLAAEARPLPAVTTPVAFAPWFTGLFQQAISDLATLASML